MNTGRVSSDKFLQKVLPLNQKCRYFQKILKLRKTTRDEMNKSSHKKSGLRIRFNVNSGPKNGSSRDTSEGGTKAVQTNSYQHQPNFSNPKFEKNYSSSIGPTTTTSNHHINQNSMQITNSNNNIIHSTIVKSNNGSNTIVTVFFIKKIEAKFKFQ